MSFLHRVIRSDFNINMFNFNSLSDKCSINVRKLFQGYVFAGLSIKKFPNA